MIRGKMMSKIFVSVPKTDLQVYFITHIEKSKEKFQKNFQELKKNIFHQIMIFFHILTKKCWYLL